MSSRTIIAAAVLAMLLSACSGDDDGGTDTTTTAPAGDSTEETTTTAPPADNTEAAETTTTTTADTTQETTTTAAATDDDAEDESLGSYTVDVAAGTSSGTQGSTVEFAQCLVSNDLLRLETGKGALAVGILQGFDIDPGAQELSTAAGLERLGLPADGPAQAAIEAVLSRHDYVLLSPSRANSARSTDIIARLRVADVQASPVYAMAFEGHWGFEPGGDAYEPLALTSQQMEALHAALTSTGSGDTDATVPAVAIVDSSFPSIEIPPPEGEGDALGLDFALETGVDDQPEEVSHGMFVASIVQQIAPDADVYGVRANLNATDVVDEDNRVTTVDHQYADELAVATALERVFLHERESGNGRHLVVNLSLGTYGCPDVLVEVSPDPIALDPPGAVLDTLVAYSEDTATGGLTVFAAAGNEDLKSTSHSPSEGQIETRDLSEHLDFYPAAWGEKHDFIIGVGAHDRNGEVVVWDDLGQRVTEREERSWIKENALGLKLMSVARETPGLWSGSSFATAVMSGLKALQLLDDQAKVDPHCPSGIMFARVHEMSDPESAEGEASTTTSASESPNPQGDGELLRCQ